MNKLIVGVILLCRGALNAQTAPAPELALDVNSQVESTSARGWPLLIRVVLVSADGQPVQLALKNGPWTQALRLALLDQNQAPQNWPMQLVAPPSPSLNLGDTSNAEAVWMVAPADSSTLLTGSYTMRATLDTTAQAAAGAWSGTVKSSGATLRLAPEPTSPTADQDALKYLVLAAYARLRGDTQGAQSALDTLMSRQPDVLEAYVEKADLLEAAGDLAGALRLKQQALTKFLAKTPDPGEPVRLMSEIDDLAMRLAQSCNYTFSPVTATIAATGGGRTIAVTAPSGCAWSASTATSWITLSGYTGTGNGTFSYTVAANTSGTARQGNIALGAQTATIIQSGAGSGNALPSPVSVLPGAGSASPQTFTFTFSDADGYQDLDVVNILINDFLDGRNACYLAYSRIANVIYLVPDAGGGLLPGKIVDGLGTGPSNSQCGVSGTGSSASGSGNTLTIGLNLSFSEKFSGNKVLYLAARDVKGGNSGWQAMGTWQVPGPSPTGPSVSGVTPGRSSGTGAQSLVFTFNDTAGFQDLGVVNVLINDALNGDHACYLAYVRAANALYLVNDQGSALLPALTLNGAGTVGNSQCTVNGAGSSASGSGNTLTLTLNLTLTPSFAGNRVIYAAARSNGDALNSGWQAVGSRTVQ